MRQFSELGEHFLVGLSGSSLSSEEAKLLRALRPLGVILFAHNFTKEENWKESLSSFIEDVRGECRGEELLVSIDHEGGRVHRFPADVTQFPPAYTWLDRAKEVGEAMALELSELGIDLSFAPVLDIHSEESNPVIGARALSTDPLEVAQYAAEFREGLESAGVMSCLKHFPGHGATTTDSHLELPILDIDPELFSNRELVPFKSCFRDESQLLMSAHVMYPGLDAENPATISHRILTTLLRDEMGFSGVVISDDLEMAAISEIPPAERAEKCLRAGVDILLEGKPLETTSALSIAIEMATGVEAKRLEDATFAKHLEASAERINSLLQHRREVLRPRRVALNELSETLATRRLELLSDLEKRIDTSDRFVKTSQGRG